MSIQPAVLWGPVQLALTATILGAAVASSTKQIIKRAVFTNMDVSNRTITVYVSRNGGGTTNADCLINGQILTPGQAYVSPELAQMVLGPGDAIYALSDAANKVNAVASGFQQ